MGARVLVFSRVHPEARLGSEIVLARLEERLVRARELAAQEIQGIRDSHGAAVRKRDLVREIREAHLVHLREIARLADPELSGLHRKFRLPRGTIPFHTFRTNVGSMMDEALRHKDVLIEHGLSRAVLDSLGVALDEFDRMVAQGNRGHLAHLGARAALNVLAQEVVHIIRAMDGCNRLRFPQGGELWAAWQSASNVVAAPHPMTSLATQEVTGLDIQPAA